MALMMTGFIAVASAWAREVRMQTIVNLTDRSDPAVKQAVKEAFDISLRGAVAMGFAQIRVDGIQILNDALVLATVATDENDDDESPDNARDQ
jgi:Na+/H+-translocating membrane pyrophosphatase